MQKYQMTQTMLGGRVTAMNDTVLGTNATPSYDEFSRLKGIGYGTRGQAFTYTYDRWGNRWYQTVTQGSGPSPQLSFNTANNQITTTGYHYDAAGNMLSDGTNNYTYDAEGNVVKVVGSTTATYIYDAFNHRARTTTTSADTYFTFNTDGLRVASWNAAAGTPTMLAAYAYWNGRPIATYTGSAVTYAHQDLLGTKRLITTSTGTTAATFQSLPFGDGYTPTGTDSDPSHFALLDHDTESDTEHAQDRQYNSTPGTWMSPDPYDGSYNFGNPQSLNRYTYAGNNPLVYFDTSGDFSCDAFLSGSDSTSYDQCEQALSLMNAAAMPNCATTFSAACGTAPSNPTELEEGAIAAYEAYSLYQGDRDEAAYVDAVDEAYWLGVVATLDSTSAPSNQPSTISCSGHAYVMAGNPRNIGHEGFTGVTVTNGSAAIIPQQWTGAHTAGPDMRTIGAGTYGAVWNDGESYAFVGLTQTISDQSFSSSYQAQAVAEGRAPGNLVLEVVGGDDLGTNANVVLTMPNIGYGCPVGTRQVQ